MRSLDWKEEELKLALELYLSVSLEWLSKMRDTTPEVMSLSSLLNNLDFYADPKPEKFRSTGSIRMKLANFKALDEKYGKSALTNVGNLDKKIWNKYKDNYELLRNECMEIINIHLNSKSDENIESYLKRFDNSNRKQDLSDRFLGFVDETLVEIDKYKREASAMSDSKDIVETCTALEEILNCYRDKTTESTILPYGEHGGMNRAPIDKTTDTDKVGQYVKKSMIYLVENNIITEKLLIDITDETWSRNTLHLGNALLKEIKPELSLKEQMRDENGYIRYWKDTYNILGRDYIVCKEWYETMRKYFSAWFDSVVSQTKFNMNSTQLKVIFDFIQKADSENLYIKRDELLSLTNFAKNETALIEKLIDRGVLARFQGSESQLVVDDYDLLYKILEKPEEYCLYKED